MKKPNHIRIKVLTANNKEENLKSYCGGKRHVIFRGVKIRMTDFLLEGIQMKRWSSNIFKVFKEKKNTNPSAWNSMPSENIFKK